MHGASRLVGSFSVQTAPSTTFAVGVLTRNRPAKLKRCLDALGIAREEQEFVVHVCDSSDEAAAEQTSALASHYPWVRYAVHSGRNAAAARNFCAREVEADLIVSLDDDVYVEPGALAHLLAAYHASGGGVVAGSVGWRNPWGIVDWSTPQGIQLGGSGRPTGPDESPDYLISAFFVYARDLALAMPWPEHLQWSEDMYMGLWWNAVGVPLGFAPEARAVHDDEHSDRFDGRSRIYVVLYRDIAARPSPRRAIPAAAWALVTEGRHETARGRPFHAFLAEWTRGVADFAKRARQERRLVTDPEIVRAARMSLASRAQVPTEAP